MGEDKNIIEQLEDTIIHKKLVLDSCFILSKYLCSINECDLALELLKRGSTHDISKFDIEELMSLVSIPENKSAFKNPNTEMTKLEASLIETHWKNNRHHPEYFDNYEDMTTLDMLEMICDWHARSIQYGTDLLTFVKTRQENRFHFSEKQFEFIFKYCEILNDLYKKEKKDD